MAIRLTISGCCGRMGRQIAQCALQDGGYAIGAALEAPRHDALGRDYGTVLGRPSPLGVVVVDDARLAIGQGDVLIEFTLPAVTVEHVGVAKALGRPVVIGTTGLSQQDVEHIREAAKQIPVLLSPNMSLGVNLLFELAQAASRRLGTGFDAEIVESHHRHKQDAPSGTAKRLAELVAQARGQDAGSIPVHAIRAGEIVGDHTVVFAGPGERVELTHRAQRRDVFAQGALRAAAFVRAQRPGLYDMSHVLSERP